MMLQTLNMSNRVNLNNLPNTTEALHKIDSEGDATVNVDTLEQVFEDFEQHPQKNMLPLNDVHAMAKYLKPKVSIFY